MTYTVEQLAPGSYDVLLNASLIAALVRDADSGGSDDEWRIDLLDEVPASERPSPFISQSHTFRTYPAALEWLGIAQADDAAGQQFADRDEP